MTITISRLFDSYETASAAVRDLESAGVPHTDISIVANNTDDWYGAPGTTNAGTTALGAPTGTTIGSTATAAPIVDRDGDGVDDRAEAASTGAGIGVGIGGVAGLLAGLGLLAIPGLGPVVAAGWLASMLTGAAAAGVVGGVVGALTQSGVSEKDAHVYAEGVRRGGSLVSARIEEADRARLEPILDRNAVNVQARGDAYRSSGWTVHDPAAPGYSPTDVVAERNRYVM